MQPFVHLHVHSQYSLLDGQASVKGLVDKAMADGMPGIALTDHGVMYGIKEFFNYVNRKNADCNSTIKELKKKITDDMSEEERKAVDEQIRAEEKKLFKPILGCEAYCARRSRHDKDKSVSDPYKPNRSIDSSGWHIILLAKNKVGYHNLIKMVSYGWTEGYYMRPRIDRELLEKYHEGIIVSSACLGGEIPQHIMAGQIERAEESILWFKRIFGDDYYLEIQRHETHNPLGNQSIFPEQQKVNRVLLQLAAKHNVKVIATNDVHFINEEDGEAHDRLICLSTGKDLDDPNRMRYSKQEWLKTTEEMNKIFADVPETMANTIEILDKVEFYSIDHSALMPDFPIPSEFDNDDDYLKFLTYEGAKKRYGGELSEVQKERIDFELNTIKNMGFPGYFLIVQDFINEAKKMGVSVGPGRGSAAGSAVAYCLGITDIDPIKYDLLFERFLNPDRISMPDIDVDFDDDGRATILRWVTEKYGFDRVAHIITYGTMATKSSIKDVARVQRLPLAESNRLAKLVPDKIPNVKKVNLKAAIDNVTELKQAALSDNPVLRDTLKYAQMLEGNVRNVGVHACGIIIGKTDISDVVPISTVKDKESDSELLVTQYEGSVIEETGLIKMDFLGLKTLSIIKEALLNIKKRTGQDIDIDSIPMDDEKTYKLYCEGRTVGTFQFESAGMQNYLRKLQPSTFEDLIAMNALYRPGPMDYIPQFIDRKHGREKIEYDLPEMEEYLKATYGITVYQEQVMLLSRKLANFTRGESDTLRKAMGKKLIDKMNALKVKFLSGGKANGHKEEVLNKIWADWEKFASYAFNKSHATCYSWVAYQTAYLKANYPSEYMAGALSRNLSNITEITKLMDECKSMGIRVLVPDVNESDFKFSVNESGDIRFGLSAIKGMSSSGVESILSERESNGAYKDIYDFVERINLSACNRRSLEALALSGAFDSFGIPREAYLQPSSAGQEDTFIQSLMRYGSGVQEDRHQAAFSLFDTSEVMATVAKPEPAQNIEPWSDLERLNKERELVGLYLSSNPLEPYRIILEHYCNIRAAEMSDLSEYGAGKMLIFGGQVTKTYQGMTKRNEPFSRITIEDYSGSFEFPLFSRQHIEFGKFAIDGLFLLVRASIQERRWDNQLELVVNKIDLLPEVADSLIKEVKLRLNVTELDETMAASLVEIAKSNPGEASLSVYAIDESSGVGVQLRSHLASVTPSTTFFNLLEENNIAYNIG